MLEEVLKRDLQNKLEQGSYRKVGVLKSNHIDFYSNDYLGFSKDSVLQDQILKDLQINKKALTGSKGSRLIVGSSSHLEQLESFIALKHNFPSALIFESGYMANLALFSSLLKKGDTYILDELVHRSILDGCRLCFANRIKFKHNDIQDLKNKIKHAKGNIIVVVESLYSMDGDFADLKTISEVCSHNKVHLIVDEAHSMGVFNYGLSEELGLQDKLLACVKTYGKAMGVQGAAVLSSNLIREYLINNASSFIFTTSVGEFKSIALKNSYLHLIKNRDRINKLQENITYFLTLYKGVCRNMASPIQILYENEILDHLAFQQDLTYNNLRLYLVKYPSVSKEQQRFRICLHANHTKEQIKLLCTIINKHLK